ncbi:MAG TPA: hypothetical protein VN132_13555 [Bdellovibrio sp.]|nr:hypothetical protein [Bdellovibrio sp.]
MKFILIAPLFLLATSAFADSKSCLSQISDAELVAELSQRLKIKASNNTENPNNYNASCTLFGDMKLKITNTVTNDEYDTSIYIGPRAACENIANTIGRRSRQSFEDGAVTAAACDSSRNLIKITLLQNNDFKSERKSISDQNECEKQARLLNK